jgi:hypothetical protein
MLPNKGLDGPRHQFRCDSVEKTSSTGNENPGCPGHSQSFYGMPAHNFIIFNVIELTELLMELLISCSFWNR